MTDDDSDAMRWQPINTYEESMGTVDLWVGSEADGQRFPDMTYRPGSPGENNEWFGDMITLSDCDHSPEDVTHYMRVTPPAERKDP